MQQHQEPKISLHLIGLWCFQCFVLVLLHSVSDKPHNQDDQDTSEQSTDHRTSNHSISRFCRSVISINMYEFFKHSLKNKNEVEHTLTQINSASWKSHYIWSIALILPKLKLGYVSDFQYSGWGCWGNKSTLVYKRMSVQVFHKHTHPVLTSSKHRPTGPGLIQFGPGVCGGRSPTLTVAGQSDQVTCFHITMDSTIRSRGLHWQTKENASI